MGHAQQEGSHERDDAANVIEKREREDGAKGVGAMGSGADRLKKKKKTACTTKEFRVGLCCRTTMAKTNKRINKWVWVTGRRSRRGA